MSADKYGVYKGNYGHDVQLRILDYNEITKKSEVVDLGEFTTKQIIVVSPSNVSHTLSATDLTDGTDGWLHAITTSGVFTELGYYRIRARIANALQLFDTSSVGYQVHRV